MFKFKKVASLLLAVIMILSAPVTVLAEVDDNFELTANTTSFYNGMSYDVIATVTNATYSEAYGNEAFSWSITEQENGASVNSKNNYSVKENGDNTYTVTETATVIMPSAGKTATVTASLGSTRTKSLSMTSKQAIESFDVEFTNNSNAYYDSNNNTLYIDKNASVNFLYNNVSPAVSDDEIDILVENLSTSDCTLSGGSGSYELKVNSSATAKKGVLRFVTKSGKTIRTVNIQICVEATKNTLSYTPSGASAMTYATVKDETRVDASVGAVAGKLFTISSSLPSSSNDDIEYVLYTDEALENKALSKYYTVNGKNCELSIDVPGTYYLTTRNLSKDNGKLVRTLGMIVTKIYISNSFPIQSMKLYKLDADQNKTDEVLENLVLYTNTSASGSTYNLTNSMTVDPVYHTDAITYSSVDAKVAKVDASTGLITAVGKGETTIWARSRDNAAAITSVDVTVKIGIKQITGITKSDGTVNIPSGHVQQLTATTNPTVVDEPIYWSTSNPDVLTVDAKTGLITAKEVSQKTPVLVYATTESGVSINTPINVVPAKRANTLTLGATCDSETFESSVSDNHLLYSDYFQATEKNRKPIIVTANAAGKDGDETNDEFMWKISFDNGEPMTMSEAATAGLATITRISDTSYSITPKHQGKYTVSCLATANVTAPKATDPIDYIFIDMLPCASTITVKDANTGANVSGTIYLPEGVSREITVKTSTVNNDKSIDPPICKVTAGGENIDVKQRPSDDGEGVTFTITGLSYTFDAAKVVFSSKSGSKSLTLTVQVRNNLDNAEITGVPATCEYTGKEIKFADLQLYYGGSKIDTAKYTVKYANNKAAGTASITFTGKEEYNGSVRVITFEIVPKALSNVNVTFGNIDDKKLSLKERQVTPTPSVTCDGTKLTKDKDYTVSYLNNNQAGTATFVVTGIGNYSATARTTFKVLDTAEKFSVATIPNQTYSGKAKTPIPTVKYNGKTLKNKTDYTLTYKNNVYTGVATVTITGTGRFYNSVSKTFKIYPKACKITAVKALKRGFKTTWSRQSDISGYQLMYSQNSKFAKGNKSKIIVDTKLKTVNTNKLKKGKTYYVRIRSFKTVGGVRYYGKWSNVKKVKVK